MPRPRFLKLSEEKRSDILTRAAAEFATHGYQGASLNRLLAAAGLSKGAFYYYFDDRDDLFGEVLKQELKFEGLPVGLAEIEDPGAFWAAIEGWVERLYADFLKSETAMAFSREVGKMAGTQRMPPVMVEMMMSAHALTLQMIEMGQKVGAVRTDLPQDLLVSVVLKAGEAIDVWAAEHIEQVAKRSPAEMRDISVPIFRRLLEP